MKEQTIGLSKFIQQVRDELMSSVQSESDGVPLLAVEEVELEIGITVDVKAEGGLQIHVIQLGVGGQRSDAHRVKVRLVPLLSLEERLAELRKGERWGKVVSQQVEDTLKEAPGESERDRY